LRCHRLPLFEHPDQRLLVTRHDRGQHPHVPVHGGELAQDSLLLFGTGRARDERGISSPSLRPLAFYFAAGC
jgi:hypothetical protein